MAISQFFKEYWINFMGSHNAQILILL